MTDKIQKKRLEELPTFKQVLERDLEDPEFRAEWERTALARAVAISVLRYRTERGLSQRGLASVLGWKQPQVARLEVGEHNPAIDTLLHLSRKLGLHFALDISPAGRRRAMIRTRKDEVVEDVRGEDGSRILAAAG